MSHCTMVLLPEPDGALKMMSLPFCGQLWQEVLWFASVMLGGLEYVEHLLFNLFQFIFHLHHDVLHFSLVAFAAGGVDFASHFLRDEPQFLAHAVTFFAHGLAEIVQMIGQTLLLFTDVQLLDVIDKLLL